MEGSRKAKWAREPGAAQAAEGLVLTAVQIYSKHRSPGCWMENLVEGRGTCGEASASSCAAELGKQGGAKGRVVEPLPEVGPWGTLSLAGEQTRMWAREAPGSCQRVEASELGAAHAAQ